MSYIAEEVTGKMIQRYNGFLNLSAHLFIFQAMGKDTNQQGNQKTQDGHIYEEVFLKRNQFVEIISKI